MNRSPLKLVRDGRFARAIASFLVATLTLTLSLPAAAQLPQGGNLVSGTATWHDDGNALEVTQTTNRAVIDWNSFSIGEENRVTFVQPSGDAVALNRVIVDDPSAILGTLEANGKLFLVNPHGILFGNNANVDVGGLVASSLWMNVDDPRNAPFWDEESELDLAWGENTGLVFELREGDPHGDVVNQGSIHGSADDSYVFLLGPAGVRNEGVIGLSGREETRVGLGAGGRVQFMHVAVEDEDGYKDRFPRRFIVDQATVAALVENASGATLDTSNAGGNIVLLGAAAAKELRQRVVNQQGVVMAKRLEIDGGESGTVRLGGSYSNSSNWDMEIEGTGERLAVQDDHGGPVVVMGYGEVTLDATEEISIDSPLAYMNWVQFNRPDWHFAAPTIALNSDILPIDADSVGRGPNLELDNYRTEYFTITSEADTEQIVERLYVSPRKGSGAINLKGRLDVDGTTFIGDFDSLDALRLSHSENQFGDTVYIYQDGNYVNPLPVGEFFLSAADQELTLVGNIHADREFFLWNNGGNIVLDDPDTRLSANNLMTLAATGEGVFVNRVGANVFGRQTAPDRVRIYSSSDAGGYDAGGLESWEYDQLVNFLEDPVPGHVIYFLDEFGSLTLIIEVLDRKAEYGSVDNETKFAFRTYLESDPDFPVDPSLTTLPRFTAKDGDGNEYGPFELGALRVGTYSLIAADAASSRYRIAYAPGSLTITPRPLTVTVDDAERHYGDYNGVLSGVPVTFDGFTRWHEVWGIAGDYRLTSADPNMGVGEYPITLEWTTERGKELGHNYEIRYSDASGNLTVTPRPIVIDASTTTRWYGDENDFSEVRFSFGDGGKGLVFGHTLTDLGVTGDPNNLLVSDASALSPPSTYALQLDEAKLSAVAENYEITLRGDLVVTKRPVIVWAGNDTIYYLDSISPYGSSFPYTHSDLGLGRPLVGLPQQMPSLDIQGTVRPVGEYDIVWNAPSEWEDPLGLYDVTLEPGKLTILPRPISLDMHDAQRVYGDEDTRAFSSTITGIPDSRGAYAPKITYVTPGLTRRSNVGEYPDAIDAVVDDPNFTTTVGRRGKLTISPAPIVLRASDIEKTYGDLITELYYEIEGVREWDDPAAIVTDVSVSADGTERSATVAESNLRRYRTRVDGYTLVNPNYAVSTVTDGYVTVRPRALYVAVGDVEYHLNERKPNPVVRFENRAPHHSTRMLLAEGCLERSQQEYCSMQSYGGDDPYFWIQRSQGSAVSREWGMVYNGPWRWSFLRDSSMTSNYNLIHGPMGEERVLAPLTMDDMIDMVFVNPGRERDRAFDPEPFGPLETEPDVLDNGSDSEMRFIANIPAAENDQIVIEGPYEVTLIEYGEYEISEITYSIVFENGAVEVPESCVVRTASGGISVKEHCVRMAWERAKAKNHYENYTAGFPNESQVILGQALAKWMDGPSGYVLSATNLESVYERLQAGDEELMAQVFPYLMAELHSILEKAERDLTPAERAYVEHISEVIQNERRRTAKNAQDALARWRAGEQERMSDAPPMQTLFDYGSGVPDYLRRAAMEADMGIGTQSQLTDRRMTRMLEVLGSIGGSVVGGVGGGVIGGMGALNSLVPIIFPFARRGGEAIIALSGASTGASIIGSAIMVAAFSGIVIADLVDRKNVLDDIEDAVRRANGPPPSFAELKRMLDSEEGQVELMMHQMNALARYAPGGQLYQMSKGYPIPESDVGFWDF